MSVVVHSPAMIARKHELSGLSLREIEKRARVTASRLCLYETRKCTLRVEQLQAVDAVLDAAIRDRFAEIVDVLSAREG